MVPVLGLLRRMEQSQWLEPQALAACQAIQLDELLAHAYDTVPFYRERWGRRPVSAEHSSLPLLTRRDVQASREALRSIALPEGHGQVFEAATSGSTGAPVRVLKTGLASLYWNAITLRDHAWHRRDLSQKLAVIRTMVRAGRAPNWGPATHGVLRTGPAVMLEAERERDEQIRWLEDEQPDILFTFASNALALARRSLQLGARIRLREVRTFGDALDPAAPDLFRQAWGAAATDLYSATETGYLALQCPVHRHYHVQSEAVILEVVDDAGRACPPGQVGRVVVTVLHSFAMPLIRYEIGDWAEPGSACGCGRGLPVLNRILGRTRNLMRTADGRVYWPYFGSTELASLAPVRNHQFVQKAPDLVQARLVTEAPLSDAQEARVRAHFVSHMPAGMRLEIAYVDAFPGSRGGKYEYFVSELATQPCDE